MMITNRNIEQMSSVLAGLLTEFARIKLERYCLWPGALARETRQECQLTPAIRRPSLSIAVYASLHAGRWMRIHTVVGTLLVPATVDLSHPSTLSFSSDMVRVSCYHASGCQRRWTFTENTQDTSEFETSPLLPVVLRDRPMMMCR